ncbi:MAG: hypothetical protein H6684_16650 [Deltaproteobacteria bacterium]|nr:hypothetical protein [Deltaproteobacteria bacterium]MCB9490364.1 hypothetical protein [Deltaproteobacteria bacterium]
MQKDSEFNGSEFDEIGPDYDIDFDDQGPEFYEHMFGGPNYDEFDEYSNEFSSYPGETRIEAAPPSLDWLLDDAGYYTYILLNCDEHAYNTLISRINSGEFGFTSGLSGLSTRPGFNNVQYKYYIRINGSQNKSSVHNALQSALGNRYTVKKIDSIELYSRTLSNFRNAMRKYKIAKSDLHKRDKLITEAMKSAEAAKAQRNKFASQLIRSRSSEEVIRHKISTMQDTINDLYDQIRFQRSRIHKLEASEVGANSDTESTSHIKLISESKIESDVEFERLSSELQLAQTSEKQTRIEMEKTEEKALLLSEDKRELEAKLAEVSEQYSKLESNYQHLQLENINQKADPLSNKKLVEAIFSQLTPNIEFILTTREVFLGTSTKWLKSLPKILAINSGATECCCKVKKSEFVEDRFNIPQNRDAGRIYWSYKCRTPTGKIPVLISEKKNQDHDIQLLRSYKFVK